MKIKFVCKKCNKKIDAISISFNNMCFRNDMTVVNHHNSNPLLVEYDREYFCGAVDKIFYDCKCGNQVITVEDSPNIVDFIGAINGHVNFSDLTKDEYGDLKVVIFNKSLAGTVVELK